jgi:hypothetical protein
MKKNRAVVVDDIRAEFLRALGEERTKELVEMCKEMYDEDIWPENYKSVNDTIAEEVL